MAQHPSRNSLPSPDEPRPSAAQRAEANRASGHGRTFWWLWSLAATAVGATTTAWAEQQFQRGVPVILGALGGFILGAIEASLINRRLRIRIGLEAPRLILAGAGTVCCLAFAVSGILLPSIQYAVAAALCAAAVGVSLPRRQDGHRTTSHTSRRQMP